ncbi:ankyrin repeat domain-containing protein [Coralloluteibacterium thermophilus]|uniref:Ankyrin repeat domain-containing protein n=1 Tax=Coralloluteibacterium thermophilum TaxID=2707049 RepID=A0ABV9NHX3_9GAMM
MVDAAARRRGLAALAAGILVALQAIWMPGALAALAAALAQAPLALAWGWLGGTRAGPERPGRWLRDATALALLWGGAVLGAGLLAWLPANALHATGRLAAALTLSGAVGLGLVVLWRLWPMYARASREGGGFATLTAHLVEGEAALGRGMVVAAVVLLVALAAAALAWPPAAGLRPALAVGLAVLAPLLHALVHRVGTVPALHLPVEAATPAATAPPPVEEEEDEPGTPDERLYRAARAGRVDAALAALAAGADPHALPAPDDRDQRTLAMLAALHADLRLLRELIARGVEVDRRHGGLTALLVATRDSWHGRPEAVTTLLANGADPRLADPHGETPLHHAARSSDAAVAALLLDAGAALEARDAEGNTPLSAACAAGSWRLARFLLERGARPEPAGGRPALLAAAAGDDDPAGVALLLRHRARVDAADAQGRTALMVASAAGNAEIVAALVAAGATLDLRDRAGASALLEAARGGHLAVIEALARAGADPGGSDAEGRNALVVACEAGVEPEVLRALLAHGVDPQQADAQGRRALDHALSAGRWRLVAVLDPGFPLPASVADGLEPAAPRTPRQLIADNLAAGRVDAAGGLVAAQPESERTGLLTGLLPDFAAEGDAAAFDWLLAQGADPEAPLDDGDCVLFRLLARGAVADAALRRLLAHGIVPAGRGGLMRYLAACFENEHVARAHEQTAIDLLEHGADPHGGDGDPPLSLAIRLGWLRLAERLLEAGVSTEARDAAGMTPLHLACALGRGSAVRLLVRHGASPHALAPDGQSPLGMALADARRDLAVWLEWRDWPLPPRPLRPSDVPAAAMAGDASAVERLIDLGLPIDAVDDQGCTALLRAAGGGHLALVERLLARGADVTLAAHTGATPLSAAISSRHVRIVEALLAHGASVTQTLPGGVAPLMLAAALGLPEMTARLLAHGADVHARDEQGFTPLHGAMLYAFGADDRPRVLALLDALLLAGAEADVQAAEGHTPLLLLLGARAEPGSACDEDVLLAALEQLLGEDISLLTRDAQGNTALHVAARHGLRRVVQRLLRDGADRWQRDREGRTPYDVAIGRGFVDVAAEFEPVRSSVSLARFLRDPDA